MSVGKPAKSFPYIATIIAFLAIVIMLVLGFWQLDRKIVKEERLTSIENAKSSANINIVTAFGDTTAYQDFIVSTNGQIIDRYFYIDNKIEDGRVGFHVLLPFKTSSGVVMLNLGWLPSTGLRSKLPTFELTSFDSVQGILYVPTINSLISETNKQYGDFPVLLQQVDLDEISKHLEFPVLPGVLRLLPEQSEFKREWKAVIMSPDKHLAYAVQWFGLAIAALTIYLLSVVKWMHGPLPTASNKQENDK